MSGRSAASGSDRPARYGPRPRVDEPGAPRRSAADIERLAELLDDRFRVPIIGWRFGLDGLIGLIPGLGDIATAAVAVYIIYRARRLGVPARTRLRMAANVAVDLLMGAVPVAGDALDFAWKANRKNVRLVKEHLARLESRAAAPDGARSRRPPNTA